jgi:excisionase family DNA binding protein
MHANSEQSSTIFGKHHLSVDESCVFLGIKRTKFYGLVGASELPILKVGKKTLVSASDLRNFVNRNTRIGGQ